MVEVAMPVVLLVMQAEARRAKISRRMG